MCLYLTKKLGIKIAEEDIVCYKVFEKQGEALVSPYQKMHYECGTMYVSETPIIVKHSFIMGPCVVKGFHSFIKKEEAQNFVSILQMMYPTKHSILLPKVVVVKCLIPAGTKYAAGVFLEFRRAFNSFCSERIIAVEEV